MNTLTRWDPFKEMQEMQNRIANFLGRSPLLRKENGEEESMTAGEWAPLVDIIEDDREYLVKAEPPEVKREDAKVSLENGVLTIRGERKFEKQEKDKKYHRVERGYGMFTRSFTLPDVAEADKVTAEFKDGILLVLLPKSEKAKSKQIQVKVS